MVEIKTMDMIAAKGLSSKKWWVSRGIIEQHQMAEKPMDLAITFAFILRVPSTSI